MPRTYGHRGSWILLGLGALAAGCGALGFFRFHSRPQGNAKVSPGTSLFPDGISPAEPFPEAMAEDGSSSRPGSEPWLEPLRLAMERSPHAFGYGKSAWTAPLLSRYLQDTQGIDLPIPQVRKALKDLGYRWEHTRYVQARAGALQDGFTSEGMG